MAAPAGHPAEILVVDDAPSMRALLRIGLGRHGFAVTEAADAAEAMRILEAQPIDAVVSDVGLPGMSGTELVRTLRQRPRTATLPILLVTGSGYNLVEGLAAGADDFLMKPVQLDELVARLQAHLRSQTEWSRAVEQELHARADAVSALGRLTLTTEPAASAAAIVAELVRRTDGQYVSILQLASGGRLRPLAMFTPEIGVVRDGPPVAAGRARYLIDLARRGPWSEPIHAPEPGEAGSAFWQAHLQGVAGAPIYAGDALAAILVMGVRDPTGVPRPERLAALMAAAIDYAAVIGSLAGPQLADDQDRAATVGHLRRILAQHQFSPVYQPIVALEGGGIAGYEALTRFADGTPPDERFAEAAEVGLGPRFELAAVRAALDGLGAWPADCFVSLNISPDLVVGHGPDLRRMVAQARRPVVLEITEHVPVDDYVAFRAAVAALGPVELAVDDAGAGYASLRHILELRPAYAKLDISLVRGIETDELRQALAAGLDHFALRTGCHLIAEGVETDAEADALRRLGIEYGQGYLFGRPVPAIP